jgi:hypothetical protein
VLEAIREALDGFARVSRSPGAAGSA